MVVFVKKDSLFMSTIWVEKTQPLTAFQNTIQTFIQVQKDANYIFIILKIKKSEQKERLILFLSTMYICLSKVFKGTCRDSWPNRRSIQCFM